MLPPEERQALERLRELLAQDALTLITPEVRDEFKDMAHLRRQGLRPQDIGPDGPTREQRIQLARAPAVAGTNLRDPATFVWSAVTEIGEPDADGLVTVVAAPARPGDPPNLCMGQPTALLAKLTQVQR